MAPAQPSQSSQQCPRNCPNKSAAPTKRNARLPVEYSRQTRHQQELALVDNRKSRLNLAKAYYNTQMAAERKAQDDRVKRKVEEERADHKRRKAERIASILEEKNRSMIDLTGAANESKGPLTRSQVKRAAEIVDLTSDDVNGDGETMPNNRR